MREHGIASIAIFFGAAVGLFVLPIELGKLPAIGGIASAALKFVLAAWGGGGVYLIWRNVLSSH